MTELKPSTEGDAPNPTAPSEPRPANIHPATPLKPAQARAARPAPTKRVQPGAADAAASTKPGSANTRGAAAFIKPSPAKGQLAAPVKPRQGSAAQTASPINQAQPGAARTSAPTKPPQTNVAQSKVPTTRSPEEGKSDEPLKPDQPSAAQLAPAKPPEPSATACMQPGCTGTIVDDYCDVCGSPASAAPSVPAGSAASAASPAPANSQATAPAKPSQPSAAEAAGSTKPGPPTTHAAAAFIKPGPTKGQPGPPIEPAQPSTAQAAASTKPDLADTQADEALIRAAMAQSAALTKPMQTNGAQALAPTKPDPAVTQPAMPTKPAQPAAQTAVPTKPNPTSIQAAAPSEPSLSSARAAGSPSPADAKPAATPAKRRRVLPIVLASVAATLVAVLAVAAIFINRVESSLTENLDREDLMPTDAPHPTKEQAAGDALNLVVMGHDSRDPSVDRSGSLMILHLSAERDQAYLISFPRDAWVSIPGHGNNKINAAYGLGGTRLTVSTLEELTDTRMDHAALVDFQGFAQLTDQVGGVTVYNKTAFSSHGVNYPKGNITVSGERAIYFVGERRALPRGDFDRATNERNVVRAIIAKTLSAKIISDPQRLFSVVSGAAEHLTVDKGLTNSKIRSTVLSLRLTDKDVHLMKAPISGKATKRGQRVDVVDKAKLAELRIALREDKVNEYLAKYPQG
jgi:LCP family protein required for cell wall assembly